MRNSYPGAGGLNGAGAGKRKCITLAGHIILVVLGALLFALSLRALRSNEFLSFTEVFRTLFTSTGFLKFILRRVALFTAIWLLASVSLKYLRKETFISASGKVARSSIPFLLLSLLFLGHYYNIRLDFFIFTFILACSLSAGLFLSLFIRFERFAGYNRPFTAALIVLISLFSAWVLFIVYMDFCNFKFLAEDFDIFDSAIMSVLRGQCLRTEFHMGKSHLGDHFSPILFLVSPFYLLWNNPRMLLLFQVLPVFIASYIVYLIAKDKLKNNLTAFFFAAAYLFLPLVQELAYTEFHEYNLVPPLILLTFYFLQKRKFSAYWIFLILMVACKEDVPIYGAAIGIVAFFFPCKTIEERKAYRKVGIATFLFCLIYGILIFKYFVPYFRGEDYYHHFRHFQWLGNGVKEIVINNILHPGKVLGVIFSAERLRSICITFLPVMLLPLLGGVTFIPVIPTLGILLLSRSHYEYRLVMHYAANIPPFVIIAAIYGAYRLNRPRGRPESPHQELRHWGLFRKRNSLCLIGSALIISCVMYSYYFGFLPFSRNFGSRADLSPGPCERDFNPGDPKNLRINPQNKVIMEFIKMIPDSASVCTQRRLATHLCHKAGITIFAGYTHTVHGQDRFDYVLLNTDWDRSPAIIRLLYEGEYGVAGYKGNILLLKSNYSTHLNEWAYNEIFLTSRGNKLISRVGVEVIDPGAACGYARFAAPPADDPGWIALTKPIRCVKGRHRIDFILKTDVLTAHPIAKLQAVISPGNILVAEREIKGTDFQENDKYQSFSLNFNLSEDKKMQFRIIYLGKAPLWVDRVQIKSELMNLEQAYKRAVSQGR